MNIPGYIIRRRLGAGGQAIVYLAIQQSLDRPVALKVLHPRFADSEQFTARFLNEGRLVANLGHQNVITIHDIGVAGELHFLSMELVDGGDLKQRIRAGLDVETILDHLVTIADCLAVVHGNHIVHRDIKPENVLFRRNGTLLLTDFGIAKHLHTSSDLTASGTTLGSPNYLSPEQAKGQPLDGRADLYSLGAMAYEMFTGERPYTSRSEFDTVLMHVNAPLPRLPDELAHFQPIIDGSMAKLPDERFGNAERFADVVRSLRAAPTGIAPTLLPVTSLATLDGPAGREPRDDPPAATRISAPTVIAGETVRAAGGARARFVIAAMLGVALAAAWLRYPAHEPVVTATVAPPVTMAPPATAEPATQAAPAPRAAAPAQTAVEVASLLARAEAALADLRLSLPRDDNALGYFRQVLALDRGNTAALAGQRRVAARYAVLATRALESQQLGKADTLVKRGLRAHPSSIDLRTLQAKLRRARATTVAASAPEEPAVSSRPPPPPDRPPREVFN